MGRVRGFQQREFRDGLQLEAFGNIPTGDHAFVPQLNKQVLNGKKKNKKKNRHSVVRSPRNHLSTILPTIPLYDFPSLLQNMGKMLYDRTQSSRLLYTTQTEAYRSSPIEPLRSRIVTHCQKPLAIHIKYKRNNKKIHQVQTFNYLNLTPNVVNKYHNYGEMIILQQRVLWLNFIKYQ